MREVNRSGQYGAVQSPIVFTRRNLQFTAHALLLSVLVGGCVTDTQFLAENSSSALRTAESRGKFELNCPQATASVLSQKVIQGVQTGAYGWRDAGAWAGPWTEYTVGVRGCGRQAVYMAVCRNPDSCNAFSQTANVLDAPQ
ncbi:MAG: hypothetical protein ACRERU_16480 [Methylococcales bacterium]